MLDYLHIGPAPADSPCVQIGDDYYDLLQKIECRYYRQALIEHYGEPPGEANLRTKGSPHEMGTYYEVVIYYNPDNEEETKYALKVENGLLAWPEEIKQKMFEEIKEKKLLDYYHPR
jgi:hypothetical protein